MAAHDIYELFRTMELDDVILSFKGEITQDLLASVYQIMESHLDREQEDLKRKKKFYHILVECLQNVYHHTTHRDNGADVPENPAIFSIGRGPDESYKIVTGNFIDNRYLDKVRERIDRVNAMSPEELRGYYLEQLNSTTLSEKGGAGLGFIDMARKSGHKLHYSFHTIDTDRSFFSLTVTIR